VSSGPAIQEKHLSGQEKGITMNQLIHLKTITLPLLSAFALACFALVPQARAVCQEGCFAFNTSLGEDANTTGGDFDTAIGYHALLNESGLGRNTAIGVEALESNTSGEQNTAVGLDALFLNTTGFGNVAVGNFSLAVNTNGSFNVAIHGMEFNTTGNNNTAI